MNIGITNSTKDKKKGKITGIGPGIVLIIGLNLAGFCTTYIGMGGDKELIGMIVAFITMVITVLCMYYCKGMLSTLPFLLGMAGGYIVSIMFGLVDFSIFKVAKSELLA